MPPRPGAWEAGRGRAPRARSRHLSPPAPPPRPHPGPRARVASPCCATLHEPPPTSLPSAHLLAGAPASADAHLHAQCPLACTNPVRVPLQRPRLPFHQPPLSGSAFNCSRGAFGLCQVDVHSPPQPAALAPSPAPGCRPRPPAGSAPHGHQGTGAARPRACRLGPRVRHVLLPWTQPALPPASTHPRLPATHIRRPAGAPARARPPGGRLLHLLGHDRGPPGPRLTRAPRSCTTATPQGDES
jgi:hypothetical protein